MRIVLSTFVSLMAATSASANVVKVTEASGTTYYVDSVSAGEKDNLRRVPVIHDYATPERDGVRSRRVVYEVDCAAERLRSVSVNEYSTSMAQGTSLRSAERESDWLYVTPMTGSSLPPRTPLRSIVKFVCSR